MRMKVIRCKCGARVPILDKKGSLYTVKCRACGLSVLNIFLGNNNEGIQGDKFERKVPKFKGGEVEGYWKRDKGKKWK